MYDLLQMWFGKSLEHPAKARTLGLRSPYTPVGTVVPDILRDVCLTILGIHVIFQFYAF